VDPLDAEIERARIAASAVAAVRVVAPELTPQSYIPHTPTERQAIFLGLPHAEAFFGGAAGGGKSESLLMAGLEHVETPNYAALILRRTFQDLAKPGALLDRAHSWLGHTAARWNEQRKQWRFPSGAVLAFGYLENDTDVHQYQSAEYQFIGFDELTQFTERQYTYLFSRLRRLENSDVPLRMRSASNPGGIGAEWVQARFVPDDWTPEQAADLRVVEKAGRAFVPARLSDNPHLDRASYAQSLANLDEVTRAQLLHGDWQIRRRGNIYTEWTDGPNSHHVITWTQFQEVFGERRIPSHWLGACGQDWGFDPDPCATVWNFVAAENSPLPSAVFVPAILTCRRMIPDAVADEIKRIEARGGWSSRIQCRVMSHEASSQLETYLIKHDLLFRKWKPDAHGGIAQMQNALRIRDLDRPHPFKPWLQGRPNYFVVVPDDQILNPKEDYGLALLRAEFAAYKYTEERVTTHLGAAQIRPYKFFDHFMDAQRGIAAEWFAPAAALTFEERLERRIEAELRPRDRRPRDPLAIPAQDGRNFGRLMLEAEIRRELEEEEVGEVGSFWDGLA
jgi:terminase large subunit-like protein